MDCVKVVTMLDMVNTETMLKLVFSKCFWENTETLSPKSFLSTGHWKKDIFKYNHGVTKQVYSEKIRCVLLKKD